MIRARWVIVAPLLILATALAPASADFGAVLQEEGQEDPDAARRRQAVALTGAAIEIALGDVRAVAGDEGAAAMRATLLEKRDAVVEEDLTVNRQKIAAPRKGVDGWIEAVARDLDSGKSWTEACEAHLSEAQREALDGLVRERVMRLEAAARELAVTLIGSELRLRKNQVEALQVVVGEWLDRRPRPDDMSKAGDLVAEALELSSPVRRVLMEEQLQVMNRMRTAKKPAIPSRDAAGDDMGLGRGRYAEDDFVLEAAALCQYHGWNSEGVPELFRGGLMLGRELRRTPKRPVRFGDAALFKSLYDPNDSELWRSLVARRCRLEGTERPDPGPQVTGDTDRLVRARVNLIVAHLDMRLRLDEASRAGVAQALFPFVRREHTARVGAFGALDAELIWQQLRFSRIKDPRRGSRSRKALCEALDRTLSEPQRIDLGLLSLP